MNCRWFLLVLLFLSTVMVSCQASTQDSTLIAAEVVAIQDKLNNLESRISELEQEVDTLREENTKLQKAQTGASGQTQNIDAATIEAMQIDIEALHRIACLLTARPMDYFNYLTDRYGQFNFDDRRGNLTIDLPGGKQIKLPIFK